MCMDLICSWASTAGDASPRVCCTPSTVLGGARHPGVVRISQRRAGGDISAAELVLQSVLHAINPDRSALRPPRPDRKKRAMASTATLARASLAPARRPARSAGRRRALSVAAVAGPREPVAPSTNRRDLLLGGTPPRATRTPAPASCLSFTCQAEPVTRPNASKACAALSESLLQQHRAPAHRAAAARCWQDMRVSITC